MPADRHAQLIIAFKTWPWERVPSCLLQDSFQVIVCRVVLLSGLVRSLLEISSVGRRTGTGRNWHRKDRDGGRRKVLSIHQQTRGQVLHYFSSLSRRKIDFVVQWTPERIIEGRTLMIEFRVRIFVHVSRTIQVESDRLFRLLNERACWKLFWRMIYDVCLPKLGKNVTTHELHAAPIIHRTL